MQRPTRIHFPAHARSRLALAVALLLTAGSCSARAAQDVPVPAKKIALPKRVYHATRLTGPPPRVDGKLDDACWAQGEWAGDYVQREPHEGQPGSQPTQLKIIYDDKYVYVAIRAYDSELAAQPRVRGKRDEFIGDIVGVNFDSYFDRRTGFEFDLTSGGSKIDLLLKNDSTDMDWNAVWDGKVGIEANAWTAEFRIPFSQLRYGNQREQVWGLHSWRWINRLQEESDWQLLPMDSPGFVYSFGELQGIKDLPPSRRIELLPYVLGKYANTANEPGDPYRPGSKTNFQAGLDAKIGLTSNLTADLTVNPDFGQVEADPSEINLTTYETFFAEKRPFFLEGKNIFDYGIDNDVMFYSRRIGHVPSIGGYNDSPTSMRILGAAKLTGKTPAGLSVGMVQAVTDQEAVDLTENSGERHRIVEPMTSYTVARVQQDIDKGATQVGGIFTATARSLHDDTINLLTRSAYSGGFDFVQTWNDRSYFLKLQGLGSHVEGSPAAIQALVLDPVHNYQRPDATHLGVPDGATSLDGTGGEIRVGKDNNGKWRYYFDVDWRSPGLELNDLGYLKAADVIQHSARLQYYDSDTGSVLRRRDLRLDEIGTYDFSGTSLQQQLVFHEELFANRLWMFWNELHWNSEALDTRVLRGGPALRTPGNGSLYLAAQTDGAKPRQVALEFTKGVSFDGNSQYTEIDPHFTARLSDLFKVETKFSYSRDVEDFQYAASAATAGGASRYVMGRMNQHTLSATVRFDLNLSPELTVSYYGSPFISTGRFAGFKLVTDPRGARYEDRFRRIDASTTYDPAGNTYHVADAGGAFTFANPDFSWRALNSNLVLRWEYQAGSTVYVVWSQSRTNGDFLGDFSTRSDTQRLFAAHPDNTILVKFNYWFAL